VCHGRPCIHLQAFMDLTALPVHLARLLRTGGHWMILKEPQEHSGRIKVVCPGTKARKHLWHAELSGLCG
jgi:hypothetical protein